MNVLFARRCTLHARVLAGCRRTMPAHAGFMVMIPMRLPVFSAREPKASGPRCPSRQGMALVRPDSWRQGRQKMPEKPAPLLKHEPCQKERGGRGEPALPQKNMRGPPPRRACPGRGAGPPVQQAKARAVPLRLLCAARALVFAPRRFAAPARPGPPRSRQTFPQAIDGHKGMVTNKITCFSQEARYE